jgi:hypothetical protein
MASLLLAVLVAQVLTWGALWGLIRRVARFETVVSLRLPVPSPPMGRTRPPGPASTAAPCAHPRASRLDASVLGRPQFLCLACDTTVPLPKE